jgi:hypothetical protein
MNAYKLAKAFAEELNSVLTAEQMDLVNDRNAFEKDKSVCHSHDVCDANMVMLDAMSLLGIEIGSEGFDDLFNEAWLIAGSNKFSPVMIENDERGRG